MDKNLRQLQRVTFTDADADAAAAVLQARIRAGELDKQRVCYAARLGDAASLLILDEVPQSWVDTVAKRPRLNAIVDCLQYDLLAPLVLKSIKYHFGPPGRFAEEEAESGYANFWEAICLMDRHVSGENLTNELFEIELTIRCMSLEHGFGRDYVDLAHEQELFSVLITLIVDGASHSTSYARSTMSTIHQVSDDHIRSWTQDVLHRCRVLSRDFAFTIGANEDESEDWEVDDQMQNLIKLLLEKKQGA